MQYGTYKTIRELSSSSAATVFQAADAVGDNSKPRLVIKLCTAGVDIGGLWHTDTSRDIATASVSDFLAATTRQKRAHAAGSRHIAAIHDGGTSEQGPWFATDYYPRTAHKLIEGHVALNPEALHHIIRSIVRGALEFKKHTGHSHGNLKPANVLIGGHRNLNRAPVVLIDPSATGLRDAAALETADLRAIGEILYQFVRRRGDVSGVDHWPLPMSPDWQTVFEDQASSWLALCNQLLDPGLSLGVLNLEALEQQLARFAPKQSGAWLKIAAMIVAVAVIGGGAWWASQQAIEILLQKQMAVFRAALDEAETAFNRRDFLACASSLDKAAKLLRTSPKTKDRLTPEIQKMSDLRAKLLVIPPPPPSVLVDIQSTPSGARISSNGVLIRFPAGTSRTMQSVGSEAIYKLELPGYDTSSFTHIAVADQPFSTNVILSRSLGNLRVEAGLAGATILLDGSPVGVTDARGDWSTNAWPIPTNQTRVTGRFTGLEDVSEVVVVDFKNVKLVPLKFKYGYVTVAASSPTGAITASVTDDVSTWRVGERKLLRPGKILLHVKPSDSQYSPQSTNVEVKVQSNLLVSVSFRKGAYLVTLSSDPTNAEVFLGKEAVRLIKTPGQVPLEAGEHTLRFAFGDLEPVTRTFKVPNDKDVHGAFKFVELLLSSEPSGAAFSWNGRVYQTPTNLILKPGLSESLNLRHGVSNGVFALSSLPRSGKHPAKVLLTRDQGWARFKVQPADASLFISNGVSGTAVLPNTPQQFPTGTNTVFAVRDGLTTKSQRFSVAPGERGNAPEVEITMDYGSLEIDSVPSSVEVFAFDENGARRLLGLTPVRRAIQRSGINRYSFGDGLTNHVPLITNLVIKQGLANSHSITLEKNWATLWKAGAASVETLLRECRFSEAEKLCLEYQNHEVGGARIKPAVLLTRLQSMRKQYEASSNDFNLGEYGFIATLTNDMAIADSDCFKALLTEAREESTVLANLIALTNSTSNWAAVRDKMQGLALVAKKPPFRAIAVWLKVNDVGAGLDQLLATYAVNINHPDLVRKIGITPPANAIELSLPEKQAFGPKLQQLRNRYITWFGANPPAEIIKRLKVLNELQRIVDLLQG